MYRSKRLTTRRKCAGGTRQNGGRRGSRRAMAVSCCTAGSRRGASLKQRMPHRIVKLTVFDIRLRPDRSCPSSGALTTCWQASTSLRPHGPVWCLWSSGTRSDRGGHAVALQGRGDSLQRLRPRITAITTLSSQARRCLAWKKTVVTTVFQLALSMQPFADCISGRPDDIGHAADHPSYPSRLP